MAAHDIWRFSDLRATHILDFFKQIQARNDFPREATVCGWIWIFRMMKDVGGHYAHPLDVDIAMLETEILVRVRRSPNRSWSGLDDDVALTLIRQAFEWLEKYGKSVRDLSYAAWSNSREMKGQYRSSLNKSRRKAFLREVALLPEYERLRGVLGDDPRVSETIGRAISITEGACAFLMLVLVGIRASELLSLNANAVEIEGGDDGEPIAYLRGFAAKSGGMSRRWVAGEPVTSVVKFLLDLTSFAFTKSDGPQPMFLLRPSGARTFIFGRRVRRWNRDSLVRRIQTFVAAAVGEGQIADCAIHPHRLRKTFAQLAVKRDKSRLDAVAAQLGHAYSSFTDNCYVRPDHQLVRLLAEYDRKELAKGLESILTSSKVGGNGAHALERIRHEAGRFRGKKSLRSLIDKLIDDGMQLAPCDWGYCIYTMAHSACHGDADGPDAVNRCPEVCSGCKNFVVTEKHRMWWEVRVREDEAFLRRKGLPEQTRQILLRRVRSSLGVLRHISDERKEWV
ncbi:site-specific integrase [Pandoraea sp. NPDC090278]|uniref:site-specific integrase n=1 Tax=Pandoraea sp. NPDC090278 TaxID=3364391 RepID=UPI00383A78B3